MIKNSLQVTYRRETELSSSKAVTFPSVAVTIDGMNLEPISEPFSHLLTVDCRTRVRRASSD